MQPVRTMVAVLFAAAIALTGCTARTSTDQPSPAPPAPNRSSVLFGSSSAVHRLGTVATTPP